MITDVEVYNSRITSPPLPVPDGTGPFQIRDIDGLGPVTAQITSVKYGQIDGEFYQGSTTGKRNIVLTVGIEPDWATQTVESLRQILYTYFMPKSLVKLRLSSTHMPTVEISGYVESCEPNIFSSDPEFIISILCPKSEFVELAPTVVTGTTGLLGADAPVTIDYLGTVPTGFVLTVTDVGPDLTAGELRVLLDNPQTKIMIMTPVTVDATHKIEMSTILGSKYLRSAPVGAGLPTSILEKLTASSVWLQFEHGANDFQVNTTSAGQRWDLIYFNRYGGM